MGPVFSTVELKEAVNIAEGEGLAVMAHVNGADHIKSALDSGVKSIEHGYWPDSSIIDYFLQTNAVWVPTCAAVYNLIGADRYSETVLQKIHNTQKTVLKEAFNRGVLIASGSDCGAWMVKQGKGTLDEYTILENMGIHPDKGNKEIERVFKKH
jgi:imidazolonepropionase-like amidohydrolase